MTTQSIALNAFALAAQEGRPRPLDILGAEVLVKLASADGAAVVFHQVAPPMSGPPLHRHSREDEWFYILDGEITFEIEGQRSILRAGVSAFASRGTAHTFQNFTDTAAKMLVVLTPGGLQQFFEELSSLNRGLPTPDMAGTERIAHEYGIELLGPPLS